MDPAMQDLNSLARDRTCAPCSGRVKSSPLGGLGSPVVVDEPYHFQVQQSIAIHAPRLDRVLHFFEEKIEGMA